jgi:DNA-binding LacI/PurR family transcriptional regulator
MARTRSAKVTRIKAELTNRLRDGAYRPGDRFLSARELASSFGISYQTAHRLLDEMCGEGLVERRAASGTYIPGGESSLSEVRLIFSSRARRPQSFGARLLEGLTERLRRDGLHWQVYWADYLRDDLPSDCYPVLWEAPAALEACRRAHRPALLLNARPSPGLDATLLDSVSLDDFFGGACAAELLLRGDVPAAMLAVVTGPGDDARSIARRDGFLSRASDASIIGAGGWYVEDGLRVAARALQSGPGGLFCANDRLAEAILRFCAANGLPRPRLVGFDDAPVAAVHDLTTIAIPWDELCADAADIIRRRLGGDTSAARQRIVTPRLVFRQSL